MLNPIAYENRPLPIRMRPDLQFEKQTHQGELFFVVKDPVAMAYYRLRESQYAFLQLLDGVSTPAMIRRKFLAQFPFMQLKMPELQAMLTMLHQLGLVLSDSPGQGEELLKRSDSRFWKKIGSTLLSVLWVKLPGIDPDKFLTWAHPGVGWIFSRTAVFAASGLMLAALLLLLTHLEEFYGRLPAAGEFFTARNAIWIMAALAGAKVLHEFGHAFACKHFGGECHQIGVMFLVFTPCMYCDTSDSWMVPSRWKRAAIGAAGMYVELILASISVFVWWNTAPGFIHYMALNVMFICSVSTLVFNVNPLLRYDGYYILSDLIEVPNLNQKARDMLMGFLKKYCLGLPWKPGYSTPPRMRLLFVIYAVSSTVYRWFITIAIIWFLSDVFEPYGLKPVGYVLIAFTVAGVILSPLWGVIKFLRTPGKARQVNKGLFVTVVLVAVVVVWLVMLIPVPHRIITGVVLQPHDAERIYVTVKGELTSIDVEAGDVVVAGQPLATLVNKELEIEIEKNSGRRQRLETQLQMLRNQVGDRQDAGNAIPDTEEAIATVKQHIEKLREDQQRLTLLAGRAGAIMPPEDVSPPQQPGELAKWSGSPLDKRNLNCELETGDLFCIVGDPRKLEAVLTVDQGEIEFVQQNQQVDLKFDEYPLETWRGVISEIATRDLQVASREVSQKGGGELSTGSGPDGERPTSATYQARVPLDNRKLQLSPGFRGLAKIHAGYRPLGSIIYRAVMQAVRFK